MKTTRSAILLILISLSLLSCITSGVEPSEQPSPEPSESAQPTDTTAPSPTPTSEADVVEPTDTPTEPPTDTAPPPSPTPTPTEPPTEEPTPLPDALAPAVFPIAVDAAGFGPSSITADWDNLWVGGASRDLIVKVRPSDGQVLQVVELAKFGVGVTDMVFDGVNVWALVADSVIRVRADNGERLGSYQIAFDEAGFVPVDLAYDSGLLWVGAGNRDLALKLGGNGKVVQVVELGKMGVGVSDMAMYQDDMWILVGDFVLKVNYYENQILGSYSLSFDGTGLTPQSITYGDGSMWIGVRDRDLAVEVSSNDGQVLQVVPVAKLGAGVRDLTYDGENVWALVANYVVKFRASDGELLGSYDVGAGAARIRYDGTYVWVTNPQTGTLIRF